MWEVSLMFDQKTDYIAKNSSLYPNMHFKMLIFYYLENMVWLQILICT